MLTAGADTEPKVDTRLQGLASAVQRLCLCKSEDEVIASVRASARALCGAAGIAVVWREGDQCHYVAEDSSVPLWSGQRFPAGSCISGWAMANGVQVTIRDIYQDARVPHEAYRPTGIHSLVMTPVGEPAMAALGAYWLNVRDPSDEEKAVLLALAEAMAAVLRTLSLQQSLAAQIEELDRHRSRGEEARQEIAFQAHLLDVVEQAVIATDASGQIIYWNAFAERLYGWTKAEAQGRHVLDLNAADNPEAGEVMRALERGASWSGVMNLRRKDGSTFPAFVHDWPVLGPDGELVAIVGVSVDDAERQRAENHQRLLINELNHRVKNTLAIVQSMAAQSLRAERPIQEARVLFEARLHALARAHGLMVDVGWRPLSLRALLETALQPFGFGSSDRIQIAGPDILVSPRTGVSLTLAVHELGTNAVKHGALSTEEGRVALNWSLSGEAGAEQFRMAWAESGGPAVTEPTSRGSGSRLIERGLATELRGRVRLQFAATGLVCEIEAPAAEALAAGGDPTALFPLPG